MGLRASRRELAATTMVLVSAMAFGTLAILVKLGFAAGLSLEQLLTFRFLLATVGMTGLAVAFRQNPLRLGSEHILLLLIMGAIGYTAPAFTFFAALRTLPASFVELVVYVYPALVALASWGLLGHHIGRRHWAALGASFTGVALLVGGVSLHLGAGIPFGMGLAFAFASPVLYASYILVAERAMTGVPPIGASALTTGSTAVTFMVLTSITGSLAFPSSAVAWFIVVLLAAVPTMLALTLFLAALPLVGSPRAVLLSTVEPIVTVLLAAVLLGERLAPAQILGAMLVLVAVVSLQWPSKPPRESRIQKHQDG